MTPPRRAAVLNAMQRFSPEAPFKRGGDRDKGCRCGRTKCLKQYCACFRSDTRCTRDCVCNDCRNDGLHEDERMMAVRAIRLNSKEVRGYRVPTTLPFTACNLYRVLSTLPFTTACLPSPSHTSCPHSAPHFFGSHTVHFSAASILLCPCAMCFLCRRSRAPN